MISFSMLRTRQQEQAAASPAPFNTPRDGIEYDIQQHAAPLEVSWVLSFTDPRLESAFEVFNYKSQQTADMCIIVVNLLVAVFACFTLRGPSSSEGSSYLSTPLPECSLSLISLLQSLLLLALLLRTPAFYLRWRVLIISMTRMYRIVVWLLYLQQQRQAQLLQNPDVSWMSLGFKLFLISPANSNIWFAVFFPLPLHHHLLLLLLSVVTAVWPREAVNLQQLGAVHSGEQVQATYERLSKFARYDPTAWRFIITTGCLCKQMLMLI
jgi:hypothetical protein